MRANSLRAKGENHRMAAVARFLKAGDVQQSVKDTAQQKLAVQYLQQELYEADDANLVDEEDMHIFGLQPITDPLELVSCNACKKPIKTSHYAVHAELCKTLNLSEEVALELRNGKVKKKPPRKERKKALPLCSRQEVPKGPLAADLASIEWHSEQTLTYSAEAKRKYKQKHSTAGIEKIPNDVSNYGKAERECETGKPDVPVPIATKFYYSQRNNRLQSFLSHMYHVSSSTDHCTKLVTTDVMHRNFTAVASSAPRAFYPELVSGNHDRTREQSSNPLQPSDQKIAQCPRLFLREAGESPPAIHNPQFIPLDNGLIPQYQIGRAGSKYSSCLPSNSGEPPESLHQPEVSASYV